MKTRDEFKKSQTKSLETILYKPAGDGAWTIGLRTPGGQTYENYLGNKNLDNIPDGELDELVGRDIANQIRSGEGKDVGPDGRKILSTGGVTVGGEGMKAFYDRMLPSLMEKYGKKWGVKVGESKIRLTSEWKDSIMILGEPGNYRVVDNIGLGNIVEYGGPFETQKDAIAFIDNMGEKATVHSIDILEVEGAEAWSP